MRISEKVLKKHTLKKNTYSVSQILINDSIYESELKKIEEIVNKKEIVGKTYLICSMDHNVPTASVNEIQLHNRIKCICENLKGCYIYGQGIGQYIMTEEYDITGEIIVSNAEYICMVGARGALGFCVNNNIQDVLASGLIDLQELDFLNICISGDLGEGVDLFDVLLYLREKIRISNQNTVLEFSGEMVQNMSLEDKMKLMCIAPELGAISAIVGGNDVGCGDIVIDVKDLQHGLVSEKGIISEIEEIEIGQGFIGGCMTSMNDFRIAAKLLEGKRISPKVKCLFSFPTNKMYIEAIDEGIVETIMKSGAVLLNSGCGACWGGNQGKIGENEVMITTAGRIVKEIDSQKIYLGSVNDVIESCIAGKLVLNN